MMDYSILSHFIVAVFLLSLSPGPDILYVMALGSAKGFRPAWITALGLVSGLLVHTLVVVLGLAELLVRFPSFQLGIQRLGACYLIYLGIRALKPPTVSDPRTGKVASDSKMYFQGVLMNLLNPKVSLFFLALFPGFLFHSQWSVGFQFGMLGLLFMGVSFVVFTIVAILSQRLAHHFLSSSRSPLHKAMHYFPAVVLFLLAAYLLFATNL